MPLSSESSWVRGWVTAGAVVVASLYLFTAQKQFRAALWASSLHTAGLQRAAELEPGNADLHHRLGRFYLFADQDAARAATQFERAVALDPGNARAWLDLAAARRTMGDPAAEQAAVMHAVQADPRTPLVAWEAANLFLIAGDNERALQQFRTVIENDPDNTPRAFYLCWRATGDVDTVLRDATPPTIEAHVAFINVLMDAHQTDNAIKVWRRTVALGQPIAARPVLPFVNGLIQAKNVSAAAEVWAGTGKWNQWLLAPTDNLIVNGSFEEEILNGGFSWRTEDPPPRTRHLDESEVHSGRPNLGGEFDNGKDGDNGRGPDGPLHLETRDHVR